jgi:hypothetical protein
MSFTVLYFLCLLKVIKIHKHIPEYMEVFFYYLPLKMVKVQKMNVDLNHFNNNNTYDILKSFEGYNSRMVLFIKVRIKNDKYFVIIRNQCRSKVTLRYIKHKYWNFFPISTGHTILVVNKKR